MPPAFIWRARSEIALVPAVSQPPHVPLPRPGYLGEADLVLPGVKIHFKNAAKYPA